MTDPTPLSPAAQAVLAAAINDTADIINKPHCDWIQGYSRQIAAALRAAADEIDAPLSITHVPEQQQRWYGLGVANFRRKLLAIATELENHQ